ncbi:alpha/beta fold hydrolase [Acrocarpospora catenulata]|uniref:alpha/beta fold hydrolase n=1 Tax=Acrocarpospora catenulata TaxID=2836182 RepID=UPI001BDB2FBC|nr:alpha/beta hydrolase [Acrocarpospora catenulata]
MDTDRMNSLDHPWLPAGFRTRLVDTNGTRLAVTVGGDGPPLVLMHGWPQTSRIWRHVMPALAERFTVVAPDLRGTGASDLAEDGYRKLDQVEDMRGLLTTLNLAGPAVVAGHDIGATVAFAWALAHPADLSAVVLLDPLLPGLGLEEAMNVAEGGMWHFGFFMAPHLPEMLFDGHELEFFTATFTAMSNAGTFDQADLETYADAYRGRARLRGGFEHYRTMLRDGADTRRLLEQQSVAVPVLVMRAGAHEPVGPDVLAQHVKNLTVVSAPTGHFIAEEAPDWFVATLNDFLA